MQTKTQENIEIKEATQKKSQLIIFKDGKFIRLI